MAQVFLLRTAKLGIDPTPLPVRFAMGWLAHMCFTFHPFSWMIYMISRTRLQISA
jgi:hypothetical protein